MARNSLSLPHERRKAALRSAQLNERVRIAASREKLGKINDELKAMRPKPKRPDII